MATSPTGTSDGPNRTVSHRWVISIGLKEAETERGGDKSTHIGLEVNNPILRVSFGTSALLPFSLKYVRDLMLINPRI